MKKRILFLLFNICTIATLLNAQPSNINMQLIIGGEFIMGKDANNDVDYSPAHKVVIDSFYIDKHEVTNLQYYNFCKDTERRLPEFWGTEKYRSSLNYPDYPVVGVSQNDAKAYAEYVGKRLPTEAEWEYAARGGLFNKNYSNGDDFISCISLDTIFVDDVRHPYHVLSGNPNNFGLYGMSGNVREWVNDKYGKDYYKNSPIYNPQGPKSGRLTVVRGGGWKSGSSCKKVFTRNALRGTWVDIAIGFRCATDYN